MKYHCLTIRPNNIYVQEQIEHDTIIKSVSLTPSVASDSVRSSLLMNINGSEVTLCNLLTHKTESVILNIPIKEGTRIELRTEGENDLDLLFIELITAEEQMNVRYKVVKVSADHKYVVKPDNFLKILSLSIGAEKAEKIQYKLDSTMEKRPEITQVAIKEIETEELTIIAELEKGIKESQTVDIDLLNRAVEVVVKGPEVVELLILEETKISEKEHDKRCLAGREISDEQCELTSAIELSSPELKKSRNKRKLVERVCENCKEEKCSEECACVVSAKEKKKKKEKMDVLPKALDKKQKTPVDTENVKIEMDADASVAATALCRVDSINGAVPAPDLQCTQKTSVEENVKVAVSLISEGIGKLIGKKSVVSVDYLVSSDKQEKNSTEKIMVRKLAEHQFLKYFAKAIKGAREGAVFKAVISKETEGENEIEIMLNIGKLNNQLN